MSKIVCFGEVLYDVFPTVKKIGGAPLNVALRLSSFHNDVSIISCIGDDVDGKNMIDYISGNGVATNYIQENPNYKTGVVNVKLNESGSASYDIEKPCAWDFIKLSKELIDVVSRSDAFIYGSLASRSATSKQTLYSLLDHARFKVLDVNLRAPHYNFQTITDLIKTSDFIKINDDELNEISSYFNFETKDVKQQIIGLSKESGVKQICVTRGSEGALFYSKGIFYDHPGYKIKVEDTVGAGDSFLAALIDKFLRGASPNEALNFACAVGALVASKKGANENIDLGEIESIMNSN